MHHCPSAALARLQLEIGLLTLLTRLPELALAADVTALDWRHGMIGARNLGCPAGHLVAAPAQEC